MIRINNPLRHCHHLLGGIIISDFILSEKKRIARAGRGKKIV
jgi:hypothetical protein